MANTIVNTFDARGAYDLNDLVEDTYIKFVEIIRRKKDFDYTQGPHGYFYKVMKFLFLGWLRNPRHRKMVSYDVKRNLDSDVLWIETFPSMEVEMLRKMDRDQLKKLMYESLEKLPEAESVVMLGIIDGMTFGEIADQLGIGELSVQMHFNKAKRSLVIAMRNLKTLKEENRAWHKPFGILGDMMDREMK